MTTRDIDHDTTDESFTTPPQNQTILQGFEWYSLADHKHWKRLSEACPALAEIGVSTIWIPPACKAFWKGSTGYDIYDLYDLGEFHQKGSVETKYGTKDELKELCNTASSHNIGIVFDAVVSHKAGADDWEEVSSVRVDPENRLREIGDVEQIRAWTKFDFPARGDVYSDFKWSKRHFNGVDYDEKTQTGGNIWRFVDKSWAPDADKELGSYDFLMFANIDMQNVAARQELCDWVIWLSRQIKLGGLRIDAMKHLSQTFLQELIACIDAHISDKWLLLGEYWIGDSADMVGIVEAYNHRVLLFDIPLMYSFAQLSRAANPDLRTVFDPSLTIRKPQNAVTHVTNHDTQEGQVWHASAKVEDWFLPLAHALILLHADGGHPCIFFTDLYGGFGPRGDRPAGTFSPAPGTLQVVLPKLMLARKYFAYGDQSAYFDRQTCIGFARHGHKGHSGGAGLAVVMTSSKTAAEKAMYVGVQHKGERWTDILGGLQAEVTIQSNGWATFPVDARSVSVWTDASAENRDVVDRFVFNAAIYEETLNGVNLEDEDVK